MTHGLLNGGRTAGVSETQYFKFYAEDFEILGGLEMEDIGRVTFWLLAGLAHGGNELPEDARLGAIVKSLRYKNAVWECEEDA